MEEDINMEKSYGGEMTQEIYKPPTLSFTKSGPGGTDPNSEPA